MQSDSGGGPLEEQVLILCHSRGASKTCGKSLKEVGEGPLLFMPAFFLSFFFCSGQASFFFCEGQA